MNAVAQWIRDITSRFDESCGTGVKPLLGNCYRRLRSGWSRVRRRLDPLRIKLRYLLGKPAPVKLHLGCGPKHFEGYVNVDLWITDATDVVCNIQKLPWPDSAASVIESHHMIEHISHRAIEETFREWHRVLVPGGLLILETPHFDEAVRRYLAGDEERLLSIFGRQRRTGDTHFYGYNPSRLESLLSRIGFRDFEQTKPQSHQSLEEPVFRLECRKAALPGKAH
ncbi:MAG TPA: methyltransferase domain-containing protein [Acidobacteriota bacterium]|jgi:SAM-dependent methyltransferase